MAKGSGLNRLFVLGAAGLLSGSAAAALGRLFTDGATLRLIAAALLSVGVSAITQRRRASTALLVSLVSLLVFTAYTLFPRTLWHGFPSVTTLSSAADVARHIGAQLRTQVPPSPPLRGLILASTWAVWISAAASCSLLARTRSAILAVSPPLAIFTFADVVRDDGSRPAYSILVLSGVLAAVFAEGLGRIGDWGPIEPWRGLTRRHRPVNAGVTKGARGVAATVLALAAFAPGLLPGWGDDALVGRPTSPGAGSAVDPYVALGAMINQQPPTSLFSVKADQPAYWRMLSLDAFGGASWTSDDLTFKDGREIVVEDDLYSPDMPPYTLAFETDSQLFKIEGLLSPWLPMAYRATWENLGAVGARYDPDVQATVRSEPQPAGYVYSVESEIPVPQPEQLDLAPDVTSPTVRATLPEGFYERYTALPDSTPDILKDLATRLAQGQPNEYRTLIAIQNHLRSFRYDTHVKVPEGTNPLVWFLAESRAGFCQQFAGTMAAMARSLGYPARVAIGFVPGDQGASGEWEVTTADAHAWPEIYVPGAGWIAFEPTPGQTNPAGASYMSPPPFLATDSPRGAATARRNDASNRGPGLRKSARRAEEGLPATQALHARGVPRIVVVSTLVAVALILVLIPAAKWGRRKMILGRRRDPRAAILAQWRVFEELAAQAGAARPTGHTLGEYALALSDSIDDRGTEMAGFLRATAMAAYSPNDPDQRMALNAANQANDVIAALRRRTPPVTRLRGAYSIRSGPRYLS